jgi:hypothetical protein
VSESAGAGEQQERARRMRKTWIIGGALVTGFVAGVFVGFNEGGSAFPGSDSNDWPPALAVGLAISYVLVVAVGGVALARQTDEFELQRQYKAIAAAAFVYAMAYPIWFVHWMGRLAPEPMHGALFILFWLSLAAAFLFYRFR